MFTHRSLFDHIINYMVVIDLPARSHCRILCVVCHPGTTAIDFYILFLAIAFPIFAVSLRKGSHCVVTSSKVNWKDSVGEANSYDRQKCKVVVKAISTLWPVVYVRFSMQK